MTRKALLRWCARYTNGEARATLTVNTIGRKVVRVRTNAWWVWSSINGRVWSDAIEGFGRSWGDAARDVEWKVLRDFGLPKEGLPKEKCGPPWRPVLLSRYEIEMALRHRALDALAVQ